MDYQCDRRKFLKYGFMSIAAFGTVMAPFKLKINESFELERNLKNVSLEDATASAACGGSFNCSGGGGKCGGSFNCSGGGGKCGGSFNCSGS